MSRRILVVSFIAIIIVFLLAASNGKAIKPTQKAAIKSPQPMKQLKPVPNFGKVPLYFIPNKGQVDKKAHFYARTSAYTLWMTKEGLIFDSSRRVDSDKTTNPANRMQQLLAENKPDLNRVSSVMSRL